MAYPPPLKISFFRGKSNSYHITVDKLQRGFSPSFENSNFKRKSNKNTVWEITKEIFPLFKHLQKRYWNTRFFWTNFCLFLGDNFGTFRPIWSPPPPKLIFFWVKFCFFKAVLVPHSSLLDGKVTIYLKLGSGGGGSFWNLFSESQPECWWIKKLSLYHTL